MAGKRGRGRGRGRGRKAKEEVADESPAEEMQQSSEAEAAEAENAEMETEEVKNEAEEENEEENEEANEETNEEANGEANEVVNGEAEAENTPSITPDKPGENPWKPIDRNSDSLYLQVRGFPYDTPIEDMAKYFELGEEDYTGCEIAVGIRGKPCGEFFFQCTDEKTALKVLYKHKEIYADTGRYVDVFRCSEEYYHRRLSINMHFSEEFDGTIKFKFIPFNSSPEGVVKSLLDGISYLEDTLTCPTSANGKTTGIAFVQFANFSEASKVFAKDGTDGIKIVESCNNELRGALLAQAKLAYMKKWADVSIGGGTYFNKNKRENQEESTEPPTTPPVEAKKPKTDMTPQSFIADIKSNAPNNVSVEQAAAPPTPPKPKAVNNSPYPHIITLSNISTGTKATEIQKFFKPHRAIAVNIRAGGMVDVAFKTHEVAEKAMEKQGQPLKDFVPDFELNSVA